MAQNKRRTVLTGPEQRPQQRSKGVNPDGSIPGKEGTLDPKKAGDNWATHQITEDGTEIHYVLPTKPGDKPPSHDGTFKGDAAERFRTTQLNGRPQHYGGFESDEAGIDYMRRAQGKK